MSESSVSAIILDVYADDLDNSPDKSIYFILHVFQQMPRL